MSLPEVLANMRRSVKDAERQLRRLDDQRANTPRAPGKWTPKQILGHLIDSAANNHLRFVNAQLRRDLDFAGYDQEAWVRLQRYEERAWSELVDLWCAYNLHLAHVMQVTEANLRTEPRARHTLDRIALVPTPADRPATLEYLMADYVAHLQHHLAQIFATPPR